MLTNLIFGVGTIMVCLFLQLTVLIWVLRYYRHRNSKLQNPSAWFGIAGMQVITVLLLAGTLIQIAVWAELFRYLGEFDDFGSAFYHSAVNFATLGYGDVVMSEKHKLLGPLEAVNGALMIGVSTGALMAAFQDATKKAMGRSKSSATD